VKKAKEAPGSISEGRAVELQRLEAGHLDLHRDAYCTVPLVDPDPQDPR
jgi:hypothetical protein